ncbi:MAG: DUF4012 domain-containing protein [Patescibacteria group bacterium]
MKRLIIIGMITLALVSAALGAWWWSAPSWPAVPTAINDARPGSLVTLWPKLSGLDQPKTYLVVMQNNDELRPSGGFIGVYGLLTVQRGQIISWTTADSYSLDRPAEEYLRVDPPAAIREYLTKYWWFRDANWSPDWPTSAEQLLWFYRQERGAGRPTGVIAFDPTVIERLLDITGPLTAEDGTKYTAENFSDALQYEVEQGYIERGVAKVDRKDIINDLGQSLVTKIKTLSIPQLFTAMNTLEQALTEKHLLLYDTDPTLQAEYAQRGWAGAIRSTLANSDYLMVVDANMAALKTDRVVDKTIRYQVQTNDAGQAIALVTIHYRHTATKHDYRTSRLRTYTRVYAPAGSALRGVWGAKGNDRGDAPSQPLPPDVSEEAGKAVFGVFTTVEVNQEQTLIFEYQLPASVAQAAANGGYRLLVQKQAGTIGHPLTVKVRLPGSTIDVETDLRLDRQLTPINYVD